MQTFSVGFVPKAAPEPFLSAADCCSYLKYTTSFALESVCAHNPLGGVSVPKSECISTEMASVFSQRRGREGVGLVANGYLITGEVSQLDMGDRQAALGEKKRHKHKTHVTQWR